jgi:PEP-CTERM motif
MKTIITTLVGLSMGVATSQAATLVADFSTDDKGAFGDSINGITVDVTDINWTITGSLNGLDADSTLNDFRVLSGIFRIQDLGGQAGVLTNGLTVGAGAVTVDFGEIVVLNLGANTGTEFFRVFFSVNGVEQSSVNMSTGGTSIPFNFIANEGDVITAGFEANVNGVNDGWTVEKIEITGADPIPEPSTTAMIGLAGMAVILRRRK